MPCLRPLSGCIASCGAGAVRYPSFLMSSPLRQEYLAALGLKSWTLREKPGVLAAAALAPVSAPEASDVSAAREDGADWAELRARVAACTRCGLSSTRTQTV